MAHDPRLLATAIDIVLRAGEIQLAHFHRDVRVDKKGAIDLVTEADLEVERMCRRVLAERFPSHAILAEELVIVVRDQGAGFDPDGIADPLAPENLLKSSGRGIFFMRSFMDDVRLVRLPEGGMEVRMVKRLVAES